MAKLTSPILLVIEREGEERRIEEFNEHIIKIGKLSSVNLRLDDPNVNRIHAVIEITGEEEAQVIDMGSSKGTRVNGKRIHKARVVTGDQIVLGDTTLAIYIGEAAVTQARLGNFGGGAEESAAAPAPEAAAAPAAAAPVAAAPEAAALGGVDLDFLAGGAPSEATSISQNPLLEAQNFQPAAQADDTAQHSPADAQAVRDASAVDPNVQYQQQQAEAQAQAEALAAQQAQQAAYEQAQAEAAYQQQQAEAAAQQAAYEQAQAEAQAAQQAAYEQAQAEAAYQQQQAEAQAQAEALAAQQAQQAAYEQAQAEAAYQQQQAQQQAQLDPYQQAQADMYQQQAQVAQVQPYDPNAGFVQQPEPQVQAPQPAGFQPQMTGGFGGMQQPQQQFTGGFAGQAQPQGFGQPQGFQQPPSQQALPQAPAQQPVRDVKLPAQYADSQEVLEVRVSWQGTILDHAHFYEPKKITIGESRKNTFAISSDALPDGITSFPLIEAEGDRLLINFTDHMSGEVHLKDQLLTLEQVKQSAKVQRTADGYQFALPAQSKVRLIMGDLIFEISFVPAPKRLPPAALNTVDHHLARSMGASFLLHGLLILMMLFADESQQSLDDSFLKQPNRFAQLIVRPQEPEKKKKKQESGGAKAKGKEGKMGKKNAPAVKRKAGQKQKNPDGTAPIDMQKTTKAVLDKLTKKGLLGLLPGGGNKAGGIITAKGFGGDDADALGGWTGSKVGAALGGGGLGLKGGGGGGGGFSGSSAGLGRIGTYGRGGGKGGRNWGKSRLRGKRRKTVAVSTGPPAIYGGLDRKIIQRIINQNRSRFKYCYERELIKNPQLQGKIHVWFQIEANGRVYKSKVSRTTMNNDRVEQCLVRRVRVMRFPAPKGGGIVIVNYPFIFRPG